MNAEQKNILQMTARRPQAGTAPDLRAAEGATAVIVALLLVVLLGVTALAIDIGHLYVVRNELQNAADAGALAGAGVLFTTDADGQEIVNPGAKAEARETAMKNKSDKTAVEVDLETDVILGHWDGSSFTAATSENEDDTTYINAVRLTAHRSSAYAIFARIFGFDSFAVSAPAVAYRGWAGAEVKYDQPMAICQDMLVDSSGNYVCTTGRMFSNGAGSSTVETARWTNFSEECAVNANAGTISSTVNLGCSGGISPVSITSISTNNGEVTPALNALYTCWAATTGKTTSWEISLPVVECIQPVTCSRIVGAVKIKVVWVTSNGTDAHYNNIPVEMEDWSRAVNCSGMDLATDAGRIACWNNFVAHFNLKYMNPDGTETPAEYKPATLYFLPSCDYDSLGGPGGEEFNVHAQLPKLVQ